MRLLVITSLLAIATVLPAQADKSVAVPAIHVALVASQGSERGKDIAQGLRDLGMRVQRVAPVACKPSAFWNADVVIVDWPEGYKLEPKHHGDFLRWHRPTLFFAGSGARFAQAWHLPTAKHMTELAAAQRGPAMQLMDFGKLVPMVVWRHGNLFYLPENLPEQLAVDRFGQLVACVRSAARFVVDRPVVRFSAPADIERRDGVAALAAELKMDMSSAEQLQALIARLRTKDERKARKLLASCLEDGPSESATLGTWSNWMRSRRDGMHWDSLSQMWRIDELAHWRGVRSSELRGDERADGARLDDEAIAIATKTVQHYGGRAFDDLQTFSCWHGELFYMWDRRRGFFRVECHVTQFARATPWKASAMDSFTDKQLVWGNGVGRGPRIAARGMYRNMIVRTFLPLMLLDPGMGLRYLKDESTEDEAVLSVRLAGRGLHLKSSYELTVSRATGEVISFRERSVSGLQKVFQLVASDACGPLTVPTTWRVQLGSRSREYTVEDLIWNPDLPAGIDSVTERLTSPRKK
jgi:hypothetical protein